MRPSLIIAAMAALLAWVPARVMAYNRFFQQDESSRRTMADTILEWLGGRWGTLGQQAAQLEASGLTGFEPMRDREGNQFMVKVHDRCRLGGEYIRCLTAARIVQGRIDAVITYVEDQPFHDSDDLGLFGSARRQIFEMFPGALVTKDEKDLFYMADEADWWIGIVGSSGGGFILVCALPSVPTDVGWEPPKQ